MNSLLRLLAIGVVTVIVCAGGCYVTGLIARDYLPPVAMLAHHPPSTQAWLIGFALFSVLLAVVLAVGVILWVLLQALAKVLAFLMLIGAGVTMLMPGGRRRSRDARRQS